MASVTEKITNGKSPTIAFQLVDTKCNITFPGGK